MEKYSMIKEVEWLLSYQEEHLIFLYKEYDNVINSQKLDVENAKEISDRIRESQRAVYITNHILVKLKDLKASIKDL